MKYEPRMYCINLIIITTWISHIVPCPCLHTYCDVSFVCTLLLYTVLLVLGYNYIYRRCLRWPWENRWIVTKHKEALLWLMRNYGHKIVLLAQHLTSLLRQRWRNIHGKYRVYDWVSNKVAILKCLVFLQNTNHYVRLSF